MENKTKLMAGALGLVLVGCSVLAQQPSPRISATNQTLQPVKIEGVPVATKHPTERYSAANCTEVRCNFAVRVTPDCRISLDPQWMGISRKNSRVALVFELKDSPGFTFPADAVFYKPRPEDKDNPFQGVTRLGDGTAVELTFVNNPGHARDYGIRIANGGTVCGTLDPPVYPDI